MCVVVLVFHASFHPYKRLRTNVTETIYLFTLCILAIIQTFDEENARITVSAILLIIATIHSGIVCIIKFYRFCMKKWHCRCPGRLLMRAPGRYRSFEDNSTEVNRAAVDPEVQAKQNLFDTVFASSTESSISTESRSFTRRSTENGEKSRRSACKPGNYKSYTG